jgi:hypothetical protein
MARALILILMKGRAYNRRVALQDRGALIKGPFRDSGMIPGGIAMIYGERSKSVVMSAVVRYLWSIRNASDCRSRSGEE